MQVYGISVYSLYWCLRRKAVHQKSNRCSFQSTATGFRWLRRPPWVNQWKHRWYEANTNLELCVCSRDHTGEFLFVIIMDCIHVHFSTGKQICYIYICSFYLKHSLSCLALSGNINTWFFMVMPHAWWKPGLQVHTGIDKKGSASWDVAVCFLRHSCTCTGK